MAANLISKLADITAAIDHVEKRGRNEFHRYAYMKAADLANCVRKELSSRNVYLSISVEERNNYIVQSEKGGDQQFCDVKMKFEFIDGDDPTQRISFTALGSGGDKGDKGVYKAMTGALKYGLRNAFQIPDESDPEADIQLDKSFNKSKSEEVTKKEMADLKKGEPNRGHAATGFATPHPAAVMAAKPKPLTPQSMTAAKPRTPQAVADSVEGVAKGVSSTEGEVWTFITNVTFHTAANAAKSKYAKLISEDLTLYVWDVDLHPLIKDAAGKDCGFVTTETNGKRKVTKVLQVGAKHYPNEVE